MASQEEWDNFAKEVIPTLKKLGYIKERNSYVLIITIISLLIVITFLSWQVYDEKFKSECINSNFINQTCIFNSTLLCNPQQLCPSTSCDCGNTTIIFPSINCFSFNNTL